VSAAHHPDTKSGARAVLKQSAVILAGFGVGALHRARDDNGGEMRKK
jgi:hypothetical protein